MLIVVIMYIESLIAYFENVRSDRQSNCRNVNTVRHLDRNTSHANTATEDDDFSALV